MKAYVVKIEFIDLKPSVWRRLIMPFGCTFRKLHDTIQLVTNFNSTFGTDVHLYEFNLIGENIRVTNDNESYEQHKDYEKNKDKYIRALMRAKPDSMEYERRRFERLNTSVRKPSGIKVDKYLERCGRIEYTYDFGDNWRLLITLEDIVEDYFFGFPTLLGGGGDAPPEDVRGVEGFKDFLEIYHNPKNQYHKEVRAWAYQQHYREYDPEWINNILKNVKWQKTEWDKIEHANYEIIMDKYRKK